MKPKNKNAAWYAFGVFASLATAFSQSGENARIPPGHPLSFALAAFWAFILAIIYLTYGSISAKLRPLRFEGISHFLPLAAGMIYAPFLFGTISLLASLIEVLPESSRDATWAIGLFVCLLLLPAPLFEINRLSRRNEN